MCWLDDRRTGIIRLLLFLRTIVQMRHEMKEVVCFVPENTLSTYNNVYYYL